MESDLQIGQNILQKHATCPNTSQRTENEGKSYRKNVPFQLFQNNNNKTVPVLKVHFKLDHTKFPFKIECKKTKQKARHIFFRESKLGTSQLLSAVSKTYKSCSFQQ